MTETITPQLPDESVKAYAAFNDYKRIPVGKRSLKNLHKMYVKAAAEGTPVPSKHLRTLSGWSARHNWQERVATWELQGQVISDEEWQKRQSQSRQADWEMAEQLREVVQASIDQMKNFVTSSRKVYPAKLDDKGNVLQPEREVITLKPNLNELLKAFKLVSDVQKLASGLPTEHRQVDHTEVWKQDFMKQLADGFTPLEIYQAADHDPELQEFLIDEFFRPLGLKVAIAGASEMEASEEAE